MLSLQGSSANRETYPPGTNYRTDYTKYSDRFMLLASETVSHDNGNESLVIAAGGAFMSNFEVKIEMENATTLQYSNYNIALNLIKAIAPSQVITSIADAKELPQGTRVTIEGVATSNVYSGDGAINTGFFDCIYIQDSTGGFNLFPVSSGVIEGQTIRVTGTLSAYQGETQIAVSSFEVIDPEINTVMPLSVTTEEAMDPGYTGLLISVEGIVSDIYSADGVINQFTVTDGSGVGALVYINAYITTAVDLSFVVEGATVSAVGLASIGENQSSNPLPRIRVRDCNEIALVSIPVVLESLSASVSSTNLQNSTTVIITVTGHYSDGSRATLASASVKLKQNGTQTVRVGDFNVTVVVNGNNKITDIYVGTPPSSGGGGGGNSQGGSGKGNQQ